MRGPAHCSGSPPGHRAIDLTVREGEILGFLGPNGAGKTTTLRMLTTLLAPTGGAATVAGCDLTTERAEELARDLGLTDLLDRKAGALSGGQRRRLDIAMALTHRPKVLFLDEPTTGLDPGSRADLWDLIRRLRDEYRTTVFLTTHYLDEADALSDRLVVVDKGTIVAEGTPSTLKLRYGGSIDATLQDTCLAITGRGPAPADAAPVAV
ncbi:ABC transporter ATP-binding protein [Streptomyces muensis]|uniref:ABC transporter ATP-binding protein n=1 Tax=Streptomyces muensis TaxID=1077944 RepID=UPI0035562549